MAGTPQVVTVTDLLPIANAAQAAFSDTLTSTTPFGFSDKAHGDALIALVNAMRTALIDAGIIKGAA